MTIADRNFIGMQLGPISLVDEGVDNLLDTMCERIGINVVFLSTVSWLGLKIGRSISWEIDGWPDHGIPESTKVEGGSYLKPRPQYYQNTFLDGFRAPDKIFEGKDALEMIIPGIRQRGMKIMPELMEPLFKYAGHGSSNTIPMANLPQCIEIDFLGRVASEPCLENPAYRKWWHGLFEDHCRNYDIDGIMWCNERRSPIDQLISGQLPTCFCKYCEASLRSEGVDMERVRTAVKNLYTYFSNLKAGIEMKDGTFIEFLRQLLANPEILLLERHWVKRNKDLDRELFGITKWCNPNLEFGLNVWNRNHLNPIRKAEWPWDEVKEYADWVKPITYQHQAGGIFVNEMSAFYETILRDASPSEWQPIIYQILGIKEGPRVSELFNRLEDWWVDGGFQSNRDECLRKLINLMKVDQLEC